MDKNFKLITLNVGGKTFTTYYDTLKQSSYFQKLTESKKAGHALAIGEESNQVFFIDRDGDIFEEIMHYLRSFEIRVDAPEDFEKLKIEATFFGFKELVLKVNQAVCNVNNESDGENYYLEDVAANTDRIDSYHSSKQLSTTVKSFYGKITYANVSGREKTYLILRGDN